jgi:hypothetical protein
MDYLASRLPAVARRKALAEQFRATHMTTFQTPHVSMQTHMLHFLDPAHLLHAHWLSLAGLKLGTVTDFQHKTPTPHITFDVSVAGRKASTTIRVLGAFDVEMCVAQPNAKTHIIFSPIPHRERGTDFTVALYTSNASVGLLLPVVSGLSMLEDLPYLGRAERSIEQIYQARNDQYRALFGVYRHRYGRLLQDGSARPLHPDVPHMRRMIQSADHAL